MIQNNDRSTLESFIQLQPSFINTLRDDKQRTLLMWAVMYNRPSIVKLFIDNSVDVTLSNMFEWNVYHYAYNSPELLKMLLSHADEQTINKRDNYKRTPLMRSSLFGKIECVRLFLSRPDINIDLVSKYGNTAYDLACGWIHSNKDNKDDKDEIQRLIKDYKK